jgi:signal transduction histidine kinase
VTGGEGTGGARAGRGPRAPRLRLIPGDAAWAGAVGAEPVLGAGVLGAGLAARDGVLDAPRPAATRRAGGRAADAPDTAREAVREPEALHPLTTRGAPLLPPRGAGGARSDVWEELDLAAAWVAGEWPAERREEVRHALRVLCVALRAGAAATPAAGGPAIVRDAAPPPGSPALRLADVPWEVPVDALAAALRRRLVGQAAAPRDGFALGPDPAAVLALAAALDAVEQAARGDAARAAVEQLGGVHALELLVDVAHDMRSPLGSILFLVERVRSAGVDAVADRQLALVHGAAFGLSTVVSDLMELARGGDRLARGAPAPFAVAAVLDEVRAILAPVAEEKGLAFDVGGDVAGPRVGRAVALQRVLLNLATNALKFTPRGGVTVRAAAVGGARVRFEVSDTGPGIPAGVQAQLFETFRDREGARTPVFSSAGLGLAICQRLVHAQGAELRVDSAPEQGTRFSFELELPPVGR